MFPEVERIDRDRGGQTDHEHRTVSSSGRSPCHCPDAALERARGQRGGNCTEKGKNQDRAFAADARPLPQRPHGPCGQHHREAGGVEPLTVGGASGVGVRVESTIGIAVGEPVADVGISVAVGCHGGHARRFAADVGAEVSARTDQQRHRGIDDHEHHHQRGPPDPSRRRPAEPFSDRAPTVKTRTV